MDFTPDSGGDFRASKRIIFAGILGLAALKIVSVCFHNYQLYEVDRLVSHISRCAEMEKRLKDGARRSATPAPATPTVSVASSFMLASWMPREGGRTDIVLPDADFLKSYVAANSYSSDHYGDMNATETAKRTAAHYPKEDGGSTVDTSACSHGISSIAHDRWAVSENGSSLTATAAAMTTAASPLPPTEPVTSHATPRNSISSTGASSTTPQPMKRNRSGIFITAVHLVPGEPAPSTSQLISRLSSEGARSVSSPSPAASAYQRHSEFYVTSPGLAASADAAAVAAAPLSFSGRMSPSAETSHSFSVVDVFSTGASASHPKPSVALSEGNENTHKNASEEPNGVVCEMEMDGNSNSNINYNKSEGSAVPPPVIIYENAAPLNTDEAPVLLTAAANGKTTQQQGKQMSGLDSPTSAEAVEDGTTAPTPGKEAIVGEAEEAHDMIESPLPYFSFTTTSVHMAKADLKDSVESNPNRSTSSVNSNCGEKSESYSGTSRYVSNTAGLPCASVYVPEMSTATGSNKNNNDLLICDVNTNGGAFSTSAGMSAIATSAGAAHLARPMVHLFIQPRWCLAPSLSPSCTKWETFLRLHHISYTVHEVHVLRSDQPQAQITDVPQQIQHMIKQHSRKGCVAEEGNAEEDAVVTEARAFVDVLRETSTAQKVWAQVQSGLRRILPAGVLPGGLHTQYSLPFIMVGGTVLKGSFNDVISELTNRGLVRPLSKPAAASSSPKGERDDEEKDEDDSVAVPPPSLCTQEEQRAIGQAVERMTEYTLRLLYEVGLLLEGSAVFSHYAAQLWSGHRYWDIFQVRRWFLYAWLAIPFLSALKADVERSLQGHELGGLTREQLYKSLQGDLVSLEQLLVASAATTSSAPPPRHRSSAAGGEDNSKELTVHFLLGKEPGPQDCALYAYLLPILRLTPRDIAHIHNPNFTYVYESRVFRGFAARMTEEAFPDLDVLLRPPRKPSLVMALSNVAWDHVEARATPVLVALRMYMNQLGTRLYNWMGPCRAALQCWMTRALTCGPAQRARLPLQRFVLCCQWIIPARRVQSPADTTASQSRRKATQAWWRFLDFSAIRPQTAATSAAEEEKAVEDGTHDFTIGNKSNVCLQDAAVGTEVVRCVEARQSVIAVLPQRSVHVDGSTQVAGDFSELVSPKEVPVKGAELPQNEETEDNGVVEVGETEKNDRTSAVEGTDVASHFQLEESVKAVFTQDIVSEPFVKAAPKAPLTQESFAEATSEATPKPSAVPPALSYSPPLIIPPLNFNSAPRAHKTSDGTLAKSDKEEPEEEPTPSSVPLPPSPLTRPPTRTQQPQQAVTEKEQQAITSAGPVSPRVVYGAFSVSFARPQTSPSHDSTNTTIINDFPVPSTHRERNVVDTTMSTSVTSSPAVTQRKGRVEDLATTTSVSNPRTAGNGVVVAAVTTATTSRSEIPDLRFAVKRVSAARAISRSLGATVEPGYTVTALTGGAAASELASDAVKRSDSNPTYCSSSPRLGTGVAAAAHPTTSKPGESASVSRLRVPKKVARISPAAATATRNGLNSNNNPLDDDEDDDGAASESSASAVSELQVLTTPASSVARSSTTRTPTGQRRPSSLAPGLFTTVVNRKVYLSDGREHPSWKVEPRRRTSSATAENRESRLSPAPLSRRGSTADLNERNGARSPAMGALSRTVTPIRKVRPSPAGRPTA